jgi:hypothetical protein
MSFSENKAVSENNALSIKHCLFQKAMPFLENKALSRKKESNAPLRKQCLL